MDYDRFEINKEVFRANNEILRVSTAIKLGIPEHVIYDMVRNGELIREFVVCIGWPKLNLLETLILFR